MKLSFEDVEPYFGIRITSAEAVTHGVVKITWSDAVTGIVDLRPILARGDIFKDLRDDPDVFDAVQVEAHGHGVFWQASDGTLVDFGADQMRAWSEKQAALIALAS